MSSACLHRPALPRGQMRFCDEDVALLRQAEKGPLAFSVGKTNLGPLTGVPCGLDPPGEPHYPLFSKEK